MIADASWRLSRAGDDVSRPPELVTHRTRVPSLVFLVDEFGLPNHPGLLAKHRKGFCRSSEVAFNIDSGPTWKSQ